MISDLLVSFVIAGTTAALFNDYGLADEDFA
jgi:hypothetical protein